MKTKRIFLSGWLLLLFVALLSSCHGMWDEEGQDCTTHKRIRFTYDWNMLYADAFAHEVKTLTLYAFDADGNIAYQRVANADSIIANGGYMNVDDIPAGVYRLQVWAQGENRYDNSYLFGQQQSGDAGTQKALTAAIYDAARYVRTGNVDENIPINHDINPLYYGASGVYGTADNADFTDMPLGGTREATVNLMKDTENFRIVLADESGKAMDPSAFHFTITDDNWSMDADNNVLATNDSVAYNAWSVITGSAGDVSQTGESISGMATVVAELTTNRLVKGHNMRLHVTRNSDGHEIINIPVIDLCLLVKGQYNRNMTDQEYLDRQDTWNFIFFLADDGGKWGGYHWLNASIYVQQWRIVLQNADL